MGGCGVADEDGMAGRSGAGRAVVDESGDRLVGMVAGESEGETGDEGVHGGEAPGGCVEWWPRESPATLLVLILFSQ